MNLRHLEAFRAVMLSGSVTQAAQSLNLSQPAVSKMLGGLPGFGKSLGLDDDWAYRAIQATGNYGEIFDRHIAPLGVERGQNKLYRDGGLIYPLPMR